MFLAAFDCFYVSFYHFFYDRIMNFETNVSGSLVGVEVHPVF